MTPSLLGPPEIHLPSPSAAKPPSNPFLSLMQSSFIDWRTENLSSTRQPPMGLTENFSPTFLSTGNPCLDFFFHVVPDTPPETLTHLLQQAWAHNPLTALKLICNLRGVRGTGKSDREGFYEATLWLQQNHPKTLALNVSCFADFGYLKDLPEVLFRLLVGADFRKRLREERQTRRNRRRGSRHRSRRFGRQKPLKKVGSREERIAAESERVKTEKRRHGSFERRRSSRWHAEPLTAMIGMPNTGACTITWRISSQNYYFETWRQ